MSGGWWVSLVGMGRDGEQNILKRARAVGEDGNWKQNALMGVQSIYQKPG